MVCCTLSSSGEKRKVCLPPLSMVFFLQFLNMKSFPGRGCQSHGGCRGNKGAAFITSRMSLLISAAVKAALPAAPHRAGFLLLGWEKGCTPSVTSHTFLCTSVTKYKEKKCNVFKMSFWAAHYHSVWKEFICMLGAFCVYIVLHFKSFSPVPKEVEACIHL